jgi:hypothetical protein
MVSVVSVWEIILKYQARKLLLATTLSLIQYKRRTESASVIWARNMGESAGVEFESRRVATAKTDSSVVP